MVILSLAFWLSIKIVDNFDQISKINKDLEKEYESMTIKIDHNYSDIISKGQAHLIQIWLEQVIGYK